MQVPKIKRMRRNKKAVDVSEFSGTVAILEIYEATTASSIDDQEQFFRNGSLFMFMWLAKETSQQPKYTIRSANRRDPWLPHAIEAIFTTSSKLYSLPLPSCGKVYTYFEVCMTEEDTLMRASSISLQG